MGYRLLRLTTEIFHVKKQFLTVRSVSVWKIVSYLLYFPIYFSFDIGYLRVDSITWLRREGNMIGGLVCEKYRWYGWMIFLDKIVTFFFETVDIRCTFMYKYNFEFKMYCCIYSRELTDRINVELQLIMSLDCWIAANNIK